MEKIMSLKDHVYEYIANQIREGALSPNDKISENVICEKLKVSRTPVREALIQLTAEGVLLNHARRGFVVKRITAEDMVELYELIGILDGLAAKKACPYLTEKDIADMEFYIDTMDLAVKSENFGMYHKQQHLFHQVYIDKCGSDTLIECLDQYKKKLLKQTYSNDGKYDMQEIYFSTNDEHKEILRLFKEHQENQLMTYLSEVHWRGTQAEFDLVI